MKVHLLCVQNIIYFHNINFIMFSSLTDFGLDNKYYSWLGSHLLLNSLAHCSVSKIE